MSDDKLWEVKHSYYCNDGNYFANDCLAEYTDWRSFCEENEHDDFDLNLIFRWDWKLDDDAPHGSGKGTLCLYYMGQRKGLFRIVHVRVDASVHDAVKAFLILRLRHLAELWRPLFPSQEEAS